jgi:signal transduction histidine kinase
LPHNAVSLHQRAESRTDGSRLIFKKTASENKSRREGYLSFAGPPWLIVIVTLSAVIFAVLAAGRGPDRETHEVILTTLRAVDVNNASLQRDVLQSRSGLLQNYDPLVASVVNLHKTIADLRSLFARSDTDRDQALVSLVDHLDRSVDRNEEVVEGFKTQNALLQNSLQIFGRTLSSLHAAQSTPDAADSETPRDLGNQMMQFSLQPSRTLSESLFSKLDGIKKTSVDENPAIRTLVTHGEVILSTLPHVDNMVSEVQASDTSLRAQDLQKEYLEEYGRLNLRSSWSRIFLGSISFVLCGYVASLIYRLRRQTDRLTQKLDFEAAMADVKACFDKAMSEDCDSALPQGLEILGSFFGASSYQLLVLNTETGEIDEHHNSRLSIDLSPQPLIDDVITTLRLDDTSARQPQRPIYINLQNSSDPAFTRTALSAGMVLGLKISDRVAAVLFLEYPESRSKPDHEELALMKTAVEVILQNIDQFRRHQEREILERRLEHAERLQAVGTLAGGIAHEFNNILGAMLGYGEMALHSLRRKSVTGQYVQEIIFAGQRAKKVIDQILTLSRKRERTTKPIDVAEIIADILPLIKISMRDGVELQAQLPDKKAVVLGNPVEIQQIVMNLCKNSSEAMAETGKITLAVSSFEATSKRVLSHGELAIGCYILISVSDNGTGISETALPHIFEPFFTTRTKTGGTGLGLAAVHGNVIALSGQIDVESQRKIGTTFSIFLPLCRKQPVPLSQFFDEASVPVGAGEIVGILEQDQVLRMMYEEKLAALGYEPIGFADLPALVAWTHAGSPQFDLILIDSACVPQPVADRFETLFPTTPYIVITDHASNNADAEPWLAGAGGLQKPIRSKDLANAIYSSIHEERLPQNN